MRLPELAVGAVAMLVSASGVGDRMQTLMHRDAATNQEPASSTQE